MSKLEGIFRESPELEVGKAGEHLVVADLLLSGYRAFLTDQGVPFDVVVLFKGTPFRIQVKSTITTTITKVGLGDYRDIGRYRWGIRRGNTTNNRAIQSSEFDFIALVALDIRKIAYFFSAEIDNGKGDCKQCIELRSRDLPYEGRVYKNGNIRGAYGLFIEDFTGFDRCLERKVKLGS